MKTDLNAALAAAEGYVGAKWRHLGRKPWAIDCIGVVVMSLAAGGIQMRDRTDYSREPWNDGLERDLEAHFGKPLPIEDRQAGDIVLMQDEMQPAPGHVGIVMADGSVVHSYSMEGVVRHRVDEIWLQRMICVYRPDWSA